MNDKSLDFELEKTTSLPELLDNIQEWASKENLFILDYRVNGLDIKSDVDQYTSENIDRLEINIGSRQVLIWENINELQTYLIKTASYLLPRLQESEDVAVIDNAQLQEGMAWVIRSLEALKKYFSMAENSLIKYDEDFINTAVKNENYVNLLNIIQSVLIQVNACKKQLFYSMLDSMEASELKNLYVQELESVINSLEAIASDLTVGKDVKALNSLENIIEWLPMGLLVFEKSGSDPKSIEQVKKTLSDLEKSLKNSDFVSLADIIDFDLRDSLTALL